MSESSQQVLSRVRKPRVHITYEVETEGASVVKELPFVVGVFGDFSGDPTAPLKSFRERKFIQIDRDNFNDVMAQMTPGVETRVENTLAGDGSELAVQLKFNSMSDFEPGRIVEQVEPLRRLLETRNQLRDLLTRIDRSEELEKLLEACMNNSEDLQALSAELEAQGFGGDQNGEPEESKE